MSLTNRDLWIDPSETEREGTKLFGHLLLFCFDYSENPQAWRHSMELLANEVMPKVAHLLPGRAA